MSVPGFFILGGTLGAVVALTTFIGGVLALISLFIRTDDQVVGDSRVLWALVVLLVPFAWLVYFVIGRRTES